MTERHARVDQAHGHPCARAERPRVLRANEAQVGLGDRVDRRFAPRRGVRLRIDDARVRLERAEGLVRLTGRDADDLGVGQREPLDQARTRVGAHVGALGGVEAGLAADDDLVGGRGRRSEQGGGRGDRGESGQTHPATQRRLIGMS